MKIKVKSHLTEEIETTLLNNVNVYPNSHYQHELLLAIGVENDKVYNNYRASLSICNGVCIDFQYEDECEEFLKLFTNFVA